MKEIEATKETIMTQRLEQFGTHDKVRSQTACSHNSYIKPKSLVNFNIDYSAFERFQAIKRQNNVDKKSQLIC